MCNPSKCTIDRLIYRFPMNFIWPRYQSISIKYSPPITIFKNNKNSSISVIVKLTPLKWKDKSTVNKCLSFTLNPSRWTRFDCSTDFMPSICVFMNWIYASRQKEKKRNLKFAWLHLFCKVLTVSNDVLYQIIDHWLGHQVCFNRLNSNILLGIPLKFQQMTRHFLFPKKKKKQQV